LRRRHHRPSRPEGEHPARLALPRRRSEQRLRLGGGRLMTQAALVPLLAAAGVFAVLMTVYLAAAARRARWQEHLMRRLGGAGGPAGSLLRDDEGVSALARLL